MPEGVETRFNNTKKNDTWRPDLRNADALLELVSFVDTEMGRALRVILQGNGMLSCGRSGYCGGGCAVYNLEILATPGDAGRIAIAVIDIEVGDSEITAVELAGEEEKISRKEQTLG